MRRLLPLAVLALGACIDDLEPQYRVTDLRLLAVRASLEGTDWADAYPGDTVRLEALVANPRGRAPVEVTWYGCWVAAGGVPIPGARCLDEAVLRNPDALATAPGVVPLGTGPAVSYTIPADDPFVAAAVQGMGALGPEFACSLFLELGVVTVVRAEGLEEIASKRVRVTLPSAASYVRNENPAIGDVLRAATEATCAAGPPVETPPFPREPTFLCGFNAPGAAQEVTLCGPAGVSGTDLESLTWQWYVTAGEFPDAGGVGNATGDSPEFEAPGGPFTLWVILRDGRGGLSWAAHPDVPVAP